MSRSLKRGKLTSRDRNYLGAFCKIPTFAGKRFFHSLPPSPLDPFFHSFPFLARQNYQIFLCSENPQKRLLRRLHYSQSSCENATPSSGTSPVVFYQEVPPPPVVLSLVVFYLHSSVYSQGSLTIAIRNSLSALIHLLHACIFDISTYR